MDPELLVWLSGGWRTRALILESDSGLGKTELGCALVHSASPAKAYHFVNKGDRIRDVKFSPGEGLMVDETCFAAMYIDDAKAIVDLERSRDVWCRNRDGCIPA